MDGRALEDRTLRRIVAMLVALAVLADRAAGRSFPVRWLVLTILRQAEVVARSFVVELAPSHFPSLDEEVEIQNSPADAALLAFRLRMLAALLEALLPPAHRLDGRAGGMARAPRGPARHLPAMTCGAQARWYHDTS